MRIIISIILFFHLIYADNLIVASQSCKATNNLKATKNSGNISTISSQSYRVLDEKQNSIYILIPRALPSGRWVDKSCFNTNKIPTKTEVEHPITATHKIPSQSILSLSWHDVFCETHRGKKECQRSLFSNKEYGFVLHGLWPQPKNRAYCGVNNKLVGADKNKQWNRLPELTLSQKTKQGLNSAMPATASGLEKHEWIKHGTCSGMSQEEYFAKATIYTKQFNRSLIASFINANRGKSITIKEIRALADRSFGLGRGDSVDMICDKGLVIEIRLNLGNYNNQLSNAMSNGAKTKPSCRVGIIDKAGWL